MTVESDSAKANSNEEDAKKDAVILYLSFSILVACAWKILFSKVLKNKLPLPFTVAVLLLEFTISIIIIHTTTNHNDFTYGKTTLSHINPHMMYYIFLPVLIFDSAFNGSFHTIKHQLLSGFILAGPGVLITITIIAICGIYVFPYNWSWIVGLMFGSILSAIDPIAVVALLHDSGASLSLAALIEASSLLNDGSSFLLFHIFDNIMIDGYPDTKHIIVHIARYGFAGPAFGLACGIISVIILNRIHNELEVEITITFGLAYLVFYVADAELGVSAVLALVAMGLYMSKYKYCISSNVQQVMGNVWKIAVYIINILTFSTTGIILARSLFDETTGITAKDFGFSIVLYIFVHIARVLNVVLLYPLMKWTGVTLSWKECLVLIWTGLRGSMSLILVLIVSLDEHFDKMMRDRFLFHTSMIVLFTLFINGTSSKYLVNVLGLNRGTKESETIILQALEHVRMDASHKLSEMRGNQQYADVDWKMLNKFLPDKLLEKLDKKNNTDFHQNFSTETNNNMEIDQNQLPSVTEPTVNDLAAIPSVYQTHSISLTPLKRRRRIIKKQNFIISMNDSENIDKQREMEIRKELVCRILSAMGANYEKQWSLGMVRRQTLNILIKSVEQAKQECSLEVHWKLLLRHFRLPILLKVLLKIDYFNLFQRWKSRLFFNHIFSTIEFLLSLHTATVHVEAFRLKFPELQNLNETIANEIYKESKIYQLNAMNILLDLRQSYRSCWIVQMTRRCAQMLLRYEAMAIIELFEMGILAENEHSRILELIDEKLFSLEYGRVKMADHQKQKLLDNSFNLIPYFQTLPPIDQLRWRLCIKSEHKWFNPEEILLENNQSVSKAYLIARGIVQCRNDSNSNYYKCGSIVGIDALFSKKMLTNGRFCAHGGLVEAFVIDSNLLNSLLTDDKVSRLIYDEIAFHMITNNYQKLINLTQSQLKTLLNDRAQFYKNESDLYIDVDKDNRIFLLSGTINQGFNGEENTITSTCVIKHDFPMKYKLNLSSIVYVWTLSDETHSVNKKQFKISFSGENEGVTKSIEAFYPSYLDVSDKTIIQHRTLSTIHLSEHVSQAQLIQKEADTNEPHDDTIDVEMF